MKILIIGGGKMGEAILAGWLESTQYPAEFIGAANIDVVEPTASRRDFLTDTYGVTTFEKVETVKGYDYVLIAVKPQVMAEVGNEVAPLFAQVGDGLQPTLVSIAAGVTIARLQELFGPKGGVIRIMPNTPLAVGAGASGLCASAEVDLSKLQDVTDLFACLGEAFVVDESVMDAVCALSGSGPAYVAWMIEVMRDKAVDLGLARDVAEKLATQTVFGTALLCAQPENTPEGVRESVCSPGGTTLAALDAMKEAGFEKVFDDGMDAAYRRSKELSAC